MNVGFHGVGDEALLMSFVVHFFDIRGTWNFGAGEDDFWLEGDGRNPVFLSFIGLHDANCTVVVRVNNETLFCGH